MTKIEKEIHSQIIKILRGADEDLAAGSLQSFKLGQIKDFGALVPAAQREGVPLWETDAGAPEQREAARTAFLTLAKKVDSRARR